MEDHDDLSLVGSTIRAVLDVGDRFLESNAACQAIAAMEVVASLRGNPPAPDAYTKKVAEWVSTHPLEVPDSLVRMSLDALDLIQRPESELCELWDDDPDWLAAMADLRRRLTTG